MPLGCGGLFKQACLQITTRQVLKGETQEEWAVWARVVCAQVAVDSMVNPVPMSQRHRLMRMIVGRE